MKRKLKNMYTEMLLDTIINGTWDLSERKDYGLFGDYYIQYFKSKAISVGDFSYKFNFETWGIFSKTVKVHVSKGSSIYSTETDEIKYSILSPIYWRLRQMKVDRDNSRKMAETNLYMDTYKEFKKNIVIRDIEELEKSLANLSKIEEEQRKQLAELKGEK